MEKDVFAIRIKEAREKSGLLQKDLAEKIGVKQQTLSGYEKGKMNPPIDTVKAIAKECNVSLDWLCGLTEETTVKIETYKDIINFLFALKKSGIRFYMSNCEDDTSLDETDRIVFHDKTMEEFLHDWSKMMLLYEAKTIDDDIYNLWLEKTNRKYDIKIGEDPDTKK